MVRYLLLPPYLKIEEKIKPHLRYVGSAPPIKTPLHTVSADPTEALNEPVRLATVLKTAADHTIINAGFKKKTVAPHAKNLSVGDHVYVRVVGVDDEAVRTRFIQQKELEQTYLQPEVVFVRPTALGALIDASAIKVELTRKGEPSANVLQRRLEKDVVLFVGNQHKDPEELLDLRFDFKVRLLPQQGVETIRSEEALLIALAQAAWSSD